LLQKSLNLAISIELDHFDEIMIVGRDTTKKFTIDVPTKQKKTKK
jgi:hypothetical protein